MKQRKYKTLEGLFKANGLRELSFRHFKEGEVWNREGSDWMGFKLSEDAMNKAYALFAEGLCSTRKAQLKYTDLMPHVRGREGIFGRLIITRNENGRLRGQYIAGQDYTAETKFIQHLIRSEA